MVRVSGTGDSETSDGRWARPLEPRLATPVGLSSSTQGARQCRVIRLRRKWQQISVLRARLIPALTNLAVSTHHVEPLSPSGVVQPSTSSSLRSLPRGLSSLLRSRYLHFRRWGVSDDIREASSRLEPIDKP